MVFHAKLFMSIPFTDFIILIIFNTEYIAPHDVICFNLPILPLSKVQIFPTSCSQTPSINVVYFTTPSEAENM
jgi:hypothetical protein